MTYDHIETFLAVVSYHNITAASEFLHVSQSTVSSRIQQLENELGAQLLLRQKGHHNVELTSFGNHFLPMATQWSALWKETMGIRQKSAIQKLTIASIDSVNNCTLVPLFNRLIAQQPNLKLTINTHHSNEIHKLVERRAADIGFVFSSTNYPDIISRPIYRELMYLICHKDSPYGNGISCKELDPSKEVHLRWGSDYQRWHDRHWSPEDYPVITVNTGSNLQRYLSVAGRWSIAPKSVVQEMSDNGDMVFYTLQEPPAPRICYELVSRYPSEKKKAAIEQFNEELEAYLEEDEDICVFESWMLAP